MARLPSPTPLQVFEENIDAARQLLMLARVLTNTRARRMRVELREAVGKALRFPQKTWAALDCVESSDVFVVLKPGGGVHRAHFEEASLRPLLRQAVVAISAAVETYVGDKAVRFISKALENPPDRFKDVTLTLGEVLTIDARYKRRRWGYREVLEDHLVKAASPAPSSIGLVFSTVGRRIDWGRIDTARGVPRGTTDEQLAQLYARRNLIAHHGDRKGTGKAAITIDEVQQFMDNARSIVEAFDAHLDGPTAARPGLHKPGRKPSVTASKRGAGAGGRPRRGQ